MPLIGLLFHQFVLYLVLGPEPADRAAILRSTPSSMPGQYMRIESVESVEIGEETQKTKYSTIPRVVARYHAVSIGGNLLVVRSKPGVKGPPFEGHLTRIPDDVRKAILQPEFNEDPELERQLVPVMFDAGDKDPKVIFFLMVATLSGGCGIATLVVLLLRRMGPSEHPSYRALSRYGAPEAVAAEIDGDVRMLDPELGSICYGSRWVIIPTLFGVQAYRYADLVWIHVKDHVVVIYLIPVFWSKGAVLHDRHGHSATVARGFTTNRAVELLVTLSARARWALVGYEPQYVYGWDNDRDGMIRYVDAQRDAIVSQRAGEGPVPEAKP